MQQHCRKNGATQRQAMQQPHSTSANVKNVHPDNATVRVRVGQVAGVMGMMPCVSTCSRNTGRGKDSAHSGTAVHAAAFIHERNQTPQSQFKMHTHEHSLQSSLMKNGAKHVLVGN